MRLPLFIANRISRKSEGSFSQSIHKVAVISIAVGIISLLLAFMILGGFQRTIANKIYSFAGQLLISKYTHSTSFENSTIVFDDTLRQALDEAPYVDSYQQYALKAGLLKANDEVQGVILKGISNDFDTLLFSENMVAGRFPSLGEGYSTDVMLSKQIAGYLGLNVGDKVLIYFVQNPPRFRNLTVVGIYETGLEGFDEKFVIGDIGLIRRINDWDDTTVGGVEVFVSDQVEMNEARNQLFDAIASDLYVESIEEKYVEFFDWLGLIKRNVVVFLWLILLVVSFSMVSILLILIMERTQMIGMLKSMGATNGQIRKIFISTGLNLIVRGMIWGNLLALGFAYLQSQFHLIPLDPANYYMSYVPIQFDLTVVLGVNLLSALLVGLSLFIPVAIISRIQPIQAIRFD